MLLNTLGGSRRFFEGCSGFISAAVQRPDEIKTKGVIVKAKTLQEIPVDVEGLCAESHDVVLARMKKAVEDISEKKPDTMAKL
jgi:hypothetical protein